MYVELQKLRQYITGEGIFHSMYFSPSYNHYGKWILSLFADLEKDHKTWTNSSNSTGGRIDGYYGLDFTYYLDDTNTLSVFLGSQKGGLVCANGTCVYQPDFINGIKLTGRILF